MVLPYRPCVVAAIVNPDGLLLTGERANQAGAWQLPQGGVDPGEDPVTAVLRELREEVGNNEVDIIKQSSELIRYLFPTDLDVPITKKYCGQEQVWFLMQFKSGSGPDLELSDGEFQAIRWQSPEKVLQDVVIWKKSVYQMGFQALGISWED